MTPTADIQPDHWEPGSDPESRITDLTRAECLKLLESQRLGRLAVISGGETPIIRPVNYVYDLATHSIAFRTAAGSKLHALRRATRAAFEIDGTDLTSGVAWSVIVQGLTREVTRQADVGRLNRLNLQPSSPGHKPHWIVIGAWTVTGRRFPLDQTEPGEQPPFEATQ